MEYLLLAALFILLPITVPPLISYFAELKRTRSFADIGREYGLVPATRFMSPFTLLWPDQTIDVRTLSGHSRGVAVVIVDRFEVGWTFNFWGLRHFFYLFPLHSCSTKLMVGAREKDISQKPFGFHGYAKPTTMRAELDELRREA